MSLLFTNRCHNNFIFGMQRAYCDVKDLEVRENFYINSINSSYNINKNMERPII